MHWLRASSVLALPLALAATAFFACSNDDSGATGGGSFLDAGGPFVTKLEAGSSCGSSGDCQTGLVCLFPASATSTCNTLAVCVAQPACTKSQVMCSCLAEAISVCGGYAENPVDPTATCEAGAVVPPADAGEDAAPSADAGNDASPPADAGSDAGDAATD
jgi:hypothetical protein